jgi:hypothetical protein
MDPKTDTPTVIKTPWHQNELVRWGVGIALGFLLSWLSSRGITPTPIPVPQSNVPAVLVLNVGPGTPNTAPLSTVAGK